MDDFLNAQNCNGPQQFLCLMFKIIMKILVVKYPPNDQQRQGRLPKWV